MDLGDRIRALRGSDRLLRALDGLAPSWLVGGAVRDLLLDSDSVDTDVVVEGDAVVVAQEVARLVQGDVVVHERFGTATVTVDDLHVDFATSRREHYPAPGALPEVEPAGLDEDLGRRDFTINAMAAALYPGPLGTLRDPHGGEADLEAGVVRVLHPRSFSDDPTRLLRALRYEARFGFRMDSDTEHRAIEAAVAGAPGTVSGSRVRDELLDLLAEPTAPAAVARMASLGIDRGLDPSLGAQPALVERALAAAPIAGAEPKFAGLAALVASDPDGVADWVESLHLRGEDRDAVLRAARKAPGVTDALAARPSAAALHALLHCEPPELMALALALGAPRDVVEDFVGNVAQTRLEITGDDLKAAGVPESALLGQALRETLKAKLEGDVSGRDEELEHALGVVRKERGL